MNEEFPLVRRTARASRLGRAFFGAREILIASWRSSSIAATMQRSMEQLGDTPLADRIRWIGIALVVASIAHLGLRALVSSTIVSALPALLFAGTAAFGAIVAWQSAAFERAWRQR